MQIRIDVDGIVGNRIDPPYRSVEIDLDDARTDPPRWTDDRLCFVSHHCEPLEAARFEDQRTRYEAELHSLLWTQLGADQVFVFDHTLRAEDSGARPPSYHVHCDYNARSAQKRLVALRGEAEARRWAGDRFAIVNVWRPLSHPVSRAPIGFVRPASVSSSDWLDVDIVFADRVGQVRGLRHNPGHRWVLWPTMALDEAAVFATYANVGVDGVAHAAVELLDPPTDAPPRRSIESRAFVRWAR